MVGFAPAIEVTAREIVEAEFFLFQHEPVYLFLSFVLAHDLQQDGAVAVEDLVGFAYDNCGSTAQANMVFVFAGNGAKDLVGAAGKGRFAQTAAAFGGGHFRARFEVLISSKS